MTSITKHTNSLKIYTYAVIFAHLIPFTYLFPRLVMTVVGVVGTFMLMWSYIDLMYQIETSNRDNLIRLINATENKFTKELLLTELRYADLHGLAGEPLKDYRI